MTGIDRDRYNKAPLDALAWLDGSTDATVALPTGLTVEQACEVSPPGRRRVEARGYYRLDNELEDQR